MTRTPSASCKCTSKTPHMVMNTTMKAPAYPESTKLQSIRTILCKDTRTSDKEILRKRTNLRSVLWASCKMSTSSKEEMRAVGQCQDYWLRNSKMLCSRTKVSITQARDMPVNRRFAWIMPVTFKNSKIVSQWTQRCSSSHLDQWETEWRFWKRNCSSQRVKNDWSRPILWASSGICKTYSRKACLTLLKIQTEMRKKDWTRSKLSKVAEKIFI